MARPRLVSSARVNCYINGKLIGRVTGINWNSSTPHREARGVDDMFVQEFMPMTVGISGTIMLVRMIGDGGAQGVGISVPQSMVSKEKYFTMVLVERETDTTLFRMEQGVCHGENWQVTAKQLLAGVVNFSGIAWSNEVGG